MDLFSYALEHYHTYPHLLGYYYMNDLTLDIIKEINTYDFVFISSDFAIPIPQCKALQFMTSAENNSTYFWLSQDYSTYKPLPPSEYTEIPTVGFVGRIPIFKLSDGSHQLHKGFEYRYNSYMALLNSSTICCDFHPRFEPLGDSAGFWNDTIPNKEKFEPLFKTNMLANQYNLCARGNANWSLRFFETLAYGRIPIYIESGGQVPRQWVDGPLSLRKEKLPFVYINNLNTIETDIIKFHHNIHDIELTQQQCREFYDYHCSHESQIHAFDSMNWTQIKKSGKP